MSTSVSVKHTINEPINKSKYTLHIPIFLNESDESNINLIWQPLVDNTCIVSVLLYL